MIFAKIDDLMRYAQVNPLFTKAFDWLKNTDLTKLTEGKVAVYGSHVFASVQKYFTKNLEDAKFESHRNFIDIQLVVSGNERLDVAAAKNLSQEEPYNPEKDIEFFRNECKEFQSILLTPGYACILFPEDAHRPCLVPDGKKSSQVHKICMKIRV